MLLVLISYDIPDNRRRLKMARMLLDFGGERVQYSVFECHITPANLKGLLERAGKILDEEADSLRIYHLCQNCRPKMVLLGVAQPTEEPGLRII